MSSGHIEVFQGSKTPLPLMSRRSGEALQCGFGTQGESNLWVLNPQIKRAHLYLNIWHFIF